VSASAARRCRRCTANFLINTGAATGHDIETLGETVRAKVKETSGIELQWEISGIGVARSLTDPHSHSGAPRAANPKFFFISARFRINAYGALSGMTSEAQKTHSLKPCSAAIGVSATRKAPSNGYSCSAMMPSATTAAIENSVSAAGRRAAGRGGPARSRLASARRHDHREPFQVVVWSEASARRSLRAVPARTAALSSEACTAAPELFAIDGTLTSRSRSS